MNLSMTIRAKQVTLLGFRNKVFKRFLCESISGHLKEFLCGISMMKFQSFYAATVSTLKALTAKYIYQTAFGLNGFQSGSLSLTFSDGRHILSSPCRAISNMRFVPLTMRGFDKFGVGLPPFLRCLACPCVVFVGVAYFGATLHNDVSLTYNIYLGYIIGSICIGR